MNSNSAHRDSSHADFSVEPLPEGVVFRIERPDKLNALTRPVLLGLAACLDELEARGARLLVVTGTGERAIHRVVGSGGSFGASPLRQEIGLGRATGISRVEIFWPKTGKTQVISGLAPNHCYAIREGDLVAREMELKSFAWPTPGGAPAHQHRHAMGTPSPGLAAPSPGPASQHQIAAAESTE